MLRRIYLAAALAAMLFVVVQSSSCKKENTPTEPATGCDVKGTYSGTNVTSKGVISTSTYKLQENNLAVGSLTPTGAAVSFGGYRNTCDSVFISSHFNNNSSYYLLKGKILSNGATISGTYMNLTTPDDFGTFSISK